MNKVKILMPQMATSEGVWEGTYIYTDVEGKELDRHRSRLTHQFPENLPDEYHQRNQYEWDDGKTEDFEFRFGLDKEAAKVGVTQLAWVTDRSQGYVWEEPKRIGDLATVRVSWHRSEVEGYTPYDVPYATLHELIQQTLDGSMRSRVWQWYVDGDLIGRTIIKEKRVSP